MTESNPPLRTRRRKAEGAEIYEYTNFDFGTYWPEEDLIDGKGVFYWYRDGDDMRPMRCCFHHALARSYFKHMGDEEKAEFVCEAKELITAARRASRRGTSLRDISHNVRILLREIPKDRPPNGFKRPEDVRFRDTLSADEIELRLKKKLEELKILDWLELAPDGKDRKK